MESAGCVSISQWLSRVPVNRTSDDALGADHVNAADFPGKPSIALEISNIMPATSRSRFNKRNRDSPAREEESRDQHPPKRPSNDYARKPRHKTREDRYEYKAAASSSKHTSRNHKEKTKRPRRSRKQTTNDGFHASNVARERLTLRNIANLGIFNRGKTSSPVKPRDVTNRAFSETNFLSKNLNSKWPFKVVVNEASDQKENSCHRELFDQSIHDFTEEIDAGSANIRRGAPTQRMKQKQPAGNPRHVLSSNKKSETEARIRLSDAQRKPPDINNETKSARGRQSATPYTWSESEPERTPLDLAIEAHLLEILHTGLYSQQDADAGSPGVSRKDYCSLQDLRDLFEARKAYWESTIRGIHWTSREVSDFDTKRELAPKAPVRRDGDMTGGSMHRFNPEVASKDSLDGIARSSQCQFNGCNHTGPDNLSPSSDQQSNPSLSDTKMIEVDVEDDEVFFRTLDAAFCAIMESENNELEPVRENPEVHETRRRTSVHHKADGCSSLPRESVDTALYRQLGLENPHPKSYPVSGHPAEERLATGSSRLHSRRASRNRPLYEKGFEPNANLTFSTPPRQSLLPSAATVEPTHSAIPSGFWRQNKMY